MEVLSVGVTGQKLSNSTGVTVPTTPLDGPSSERSRGEHEDEILMPNGAACGSQYRVLMRDRARVELEVLSVGCSPHSCAALHQHPAAKRPGEAAGPILGNEGTDLSDVDRRSGHNGSPPSLRFGTTCAQGTGLPSS